MVIDRIENCTLYFGLHPDFQRAFNWLLQQDLDHLEQERYILEEGKLWATVQRYTSKPKDACKVEGHEKFFDIQFMLRGCELVGYENRAGKQPLTEYDPQHDIQFFEDSCDFITIPAGTFYIAGPDDLHMTKCMHSQPTDIVKLVMKVKC